MKTKLIITSAAVIALAATFFSFKTGEKDSSSIALVNTVVGKSDNEGFLIVYGDGSFELKNFNFKAGSDNALESVSKMSVIMNELHAKGYHYVGPASHTAYMVTGYLVFEKK